MINDFLTPEGRSAAWEAYHSDIPTIVDELAMQRKKPNAYQNVIFKVVGITKSKGGSGFSNQDDMLFVPLSSAQRYLSGGDFVSSINVQASDQKSMQALQNEITALLLANHNIGL